ncbi:MAG TPA: MBL fold metallo-hydrolase [Bacteroidales bacterium]|nr:MBL fold metallo-hydrolase [Bacteroidales bacterium]
MKIKSARGTKIHIILAGMTNCYLIQKKGINILVDSGVSKSYKKLKHQLKLILGDHRFIDYHFLTHTHYDHAGNSKKIKEDFKAKIIVHKNEAEWIKEGFTPLPRGTSWLFKLITYSGNKYASSIGKFEPAMPDIIVTDQLSFFDDIKIIHTPGHTIGSVSLLIDNEIALVGDTLFGIFKKRIFPPFADNIDELHKSWELLLSTKCKLFLPGHGKPVKRDQFEHCFLKRNR